MQRVRVSERGSGSPSAALFLVLPCFSFYPIFPFTILFLLPYIPDCFCSRVVKAKDSARPGFPEECAGLGFSTAQEPQGAFQVTAEAVGVYLRLAFL